MRNLLMSSAEGFPTLELSKLPCNGNCSGNGECVHGICLCNIQYTGWSCGESNLSYYISLSTFFYIICITAIMQFILRICSESKSDQPTSNHLFKIDIQKLVYVFVICASGSRAVYFMLGVLDHTPDAVKKNLFSTFYPFMLSGLSLVICFWAESFHLSGLQLDRPRFLTKSCYAFVAFNAIVYIMLIGQFIANHILHLPLATKINEAFNGCVAFFMFLLLVFFLIYGIEIFYKIKGAFKQSETAAKKHINFHQRFQSWIGLGFQAVFQLALASFLLSEVLGGMWKEKLSVFDRNIIHIMFRCAELGCVLWFPCCFWNVTKPRDLWIINPKILFQQEEVCDESMNKENLPFISDPETSSNYDTFEDKKDMVDADSTCWICYDTDKPECMIQPCKCKGDMKLVHHDCLKKWFVEQASSGSSKENHCCPVCKDDYKVRRDNTVFCRPDKVTFKDWVETFIILFTMSSLPVISYFLWYKIHQHVVRGVMVLIMLLLEYLCLRMLGFNFMKAYNITKARAYKILG